MVGILFIKCLRKLSFANIHGYIEGVAGNETHYALNDLRIILINLFYLAVILFYVYPLKFLFSLLLASWTGIDLFP